MRSRTAKPQGMHTCKVGSQGKVAKPKGQRYKWPCGYLQQFVKQQLTTAAGQPCCELSHLVAAPPTRYQQGSIDCLHAWISARRQSVPKSARHDDAHAALTGQMPIMKNSCSKMGLIAKPSLPASPESFFK